MCVGLAPTDDDDDRDPSLACHRPLQWRSRLTRRHTCPPGPWQVPYARPPNGSLRFAAARRGEPWAPRVLDATGAGVPKICWENGATAVRHREGPTGAVSQI